MVQVEQTGEKKNTFRVLVSIAEETDHLKYPDMNKSDTLNHITKK